MTLVLSKFAFRHASVLPRVGRVQIANGEDAAGNAGPLKARALTHGPRGEVDVNEAVGVSVDSVDKTVVITRRELLLVAHDKHFAVLVDGGGRPRALLSTGQPPIQLEVTGPESFAQPGDIPAHHLLGRLVEQG